jgi:hypothetical protein
MRRPDGPGTAVALAIGLAFAGGCADSSVEAVTVLNYNQCKGLEAGLTRVDYAAVAGIRGSTLLSMTEPERSRPEDADQPGTPPGSRDDLLLVAISRGRQPTPGYTLALEGARRQDGTAVVSLRWETPESGAVLAQMMTHPCLVVSLPGTGLTRVEAVDQSGSSLGSLDL